MTEHLTAEDVLPIVASLTPNERARLLKLIASREGGDQALYRAVPPSRDEFASDEEPLGWDAEGWETTG